ncbi:MAG: heme-binding domain-containing protein [Bacteroidota bacterium]
MGRFFKYFFVLLILAFVGIQFIEIEKTNPPIIADINAPAEVKNLFKMACYDCHSNETKWPWYSSVAPVSWLIEKDVREGRGHLNFSEWELMKSDKKAEYKKEIWEEVNEGNMPLPIYTYLHPNAKLDITQKNIIRQWALGNKSN